MEWNLTVYAVALLLPTFVSAVVAQYAWRYRAARGGLSLALLMIAVVVFAGASTLEAAAVGIPAKVSWSKIQYLGSMTAPAFFFVFALDYARCQRWLNWRTIAMVFSVPVLVIALAWTNEFHQLIWTGFRPSPAGENLLIYEHGPAFWVAVADVYLLMAVGTFILLRSAIKSFSVYRRQAIAVVVATLAAWSGSIVYVFDLSPVPGFDWTVIAFSLTGMALAWGIAQFRLFDLVPVARETLIESMKDGILVFDPGGRLVDLNRAAMELLELSERPIGLPAQQVLTDRRELYDLVQSESSPRIELCLGKPPHDLEATRSPLPLRRGRPGGWLLVLHDVTEYKRVEQQGRLSEERLRQVIDLVPNFIFAKDTAGRFVLANQAIAAAYGTTADQLIGKTDADFAPSNEEARHFHHDDLAVIRSGRPLTIAEETITTAAGDVRYLQTTKIPFKLAGSDAAALLGVSVDVTERRQAEDALINSEALYHTLVESLPVNIFRKDLAGRFIYANLRYCQSQHKTLNAIIGKTDFDLHPRELAEKYRADDRRITEDGQTFETVESYQPLGGEVTWVQTLKTPLYAPDGRITGVQGMFWDVTERKRAEAVEAQRTREMAALYETALDINTQIDLPTLLQAIVRRAAEVLDARLGGLYLVRPDKQVLELVVVHNLPDGYLGTQLKFGEGLSGIIAQTGETMLIEDYSAWPGRTTAYAGTPFRRMLGIPLKVGGRIIGVINISDDERTGRYTDDQVRLASLLADHAAIAIEKVRLLDETIERAERLALLNRIARAIGATLNLNDLVEIIHREIMSVMPAEAFFVALYDDKTNELDFRIRIDRDVREPAERRPLQEGITGLVVSRRQPLLIRDFEHEKDRLPPVRIWGTMQAPPSVMCVPMLLGEKVVGVISVQAYRPYAFGEAELELLSTIADTVAVAVDNARLFDASQHHAEDLEQRVRARTQELTRAYEHLQDLDHLKDEFVSRISHELRTPIANIQLYLGLIQHGKADKHDEYLQTLQRETARLNKLIEDLLAISQLDLGQTSINLVPVDVNRLIVHLQPDWQAAAQERGLAFSFTGAPDLPPARADMALLTRAISNLVSNALNYTPPGRAVTIDTAQGRNDQQDWIVLSVRDTGAGLALDELSHVFERFYRGRAARNYKAPGTGLGLAMCKEIMDKLGGRVTVESVEGQGAAFALWLRSI